MYIAFLTFFSLFFLISTFFYLFVNIKNNNLSIWNKKRTLNLFMYFTLIIAIILIIIANITTNINKESFYNNIEILKMAIIAYATTNSLILTFFFIIILFAPIRIYYITKQIYFNKSVLLNYLKRFLIYGTLAICSCLIIYSFQNIETIFFNNDFNLVQPNIKINKDLLEIYLNIKMLLNNLLKLEWTGWVYIGYFLICFLISYCILYFKFSIYNLKPHKIFRWTNNFTYFLIPIGFSAIVSTCILNYQSFIYRILILFLTLFIFFIFTFIIFQIFKNKYSNKYYSIYFLKGAIYPIFFIAYLAMSTQKLFHANIALNVNFWFCLYIASIINGIMHFEKNQNIPISKYNLSFLTPYVSSGINSSPLIYLNSLFDLYLKYQNKYLIF